MTGFDPNRVPNIGESERRASAAEWQRIEERHTNRWLAAVGAVAAVVVALGVWAIDNGLLSGRWPW